MSHPVSWKKKFLFRVSALCLGMLLALAILEITLRIFNPLGVRQRASWHFLLWEAVIPSKNPEKVWEYRPGYRRKLVGYRVSLNSLGLRGGEISEEKGKKSLRVMILGDSMAFGMSGEQEDCMPAQLQKLLAESMPDTRVEVINGGIIGYTTLQEEALLYEIYPKLRPDLVVLWWVHNDVELTGAANPASQEEELRSLVGYKSRNLYRYLLHWGYEVLPCSVALLRTLTIARREGDQSHFQFDPERNPEGWLKNRESLARINHYLKTEGVPLVLYSFGKYDEIAEICRNLKIPYSYSVEKAGVEHEREYAVHSCDPHFNREGNALVASTLKKSIMEYCLLK